MSDWYKLVGPNHDVVQCTFEELAELLIEEGSERQIDYTKLPDGVEISTVFLGLDHRVRTEGPPLVFETRVFGGPRDSYYERCSTYQEALAMHQRVLSMFVGRLRIVK